MSGSNPGSFRPRRQTQPAASTTAAAATGTDSRLKRGRSDTSEQPGSAPQRPSSLDLLRDKRAKRAQAGVPPTKADSSDSESGYDDDGSSQEGSPVSSAASSVHSSTPGTDAGSVSSAKKTVQWSDNVPAGKVKVCAWPEDMSREARIEAYQAAESAETFADFLTRSVTEQNRTLGKVKGLFDSRARDAKAREEEASQGTANSKPNLDQYVLKYLANKCSKKVDAVIPSTLGHMTEDTRTRYILKAMREEVKTNYHGSINDFKWPEAWKEQAKAPPDKETIRLKSKTAQELYREKYWLPKYGSTLKTPEGKQLTLEQARTHYDQKLNHSQVHFPRTHEICSELLALASEPTGVTETADVVAFDALTQDQLARVEALKAIADEGGTEAEIMQKWNDKFGTPSPPSGMPEVRITENEVRFVRPPAGVTMTGQMSDGTEITCKTSSIASVASTSVAQSSLAPGATILDTSGLNPFAATEEYLALADDWKTLEKTYDEREKLRKQEEATKTAEAAAVAKEKAKLKPLPSTNGASSLLTIPKSQKTEGTTDTSGEATGADDSITSWNGHPMQRWLLSGGMPTTTNAGAQHGRWRNFATGMHNISKKWPQLDKQAAIHAATALADSLWTKSNKPMSELPEFLKSHGIETTAQEMKETIESKDRPRAYTDQIMLDWAQKPSWRPGTAEPLSAIEACTREMRRSLLACDLPNSWSVDQTNVMSSYIADSMMGATTQAEVMARRDEAMTTIQKEMEKNPSWKPDKDTKWDLGRTTGTGVASTAGTSTASTAPASTTASTTASTVANTTVPSSTASSNT